MNRLVSVIMPVYNGEDFLTVALESVVAQTYPHWELVVVDDGSTDATARIVGNLSQTTARVRYTYQENRGQAAALNRGLELVQGHYVTTLDADDLLPSNSLADRAAFLDRHPECGAVYGDGYYCNASAEPQLRFSDRRPGQLDKAGVVGDLYETLILTPYFGTGAAVMIRQKALERYDLRYDESIAWCQDWDLYIRLAERAAFGAVDSIVIRYRLHQTNMTLGLPEGKRVASLLRLKRKVLESPRFAAVSVAQQSAFFYNLLVRDLQDRLDDQFALLEHARFRALPKSEQGRLLRQMSVDYLVRQEHLAAARDWLQAARVLAPWDMRTNLVASLAQLHPGLAGRVAKCWHRGRRRNQVLSPFDMTAHAGNRRPAGDSLHAAA